MLLNKHLNTFIDNTYFLECSSVCQIFLFRNLQLFNDAFDLANPPSNPEDETSLEKNVRIRSYFRVMTSRYGSKWLDTFLDETTTFSVDNPDNFAFQVNRK